MRRVSRQDVAQRAQEQKEGGKKGERPLHGNGKDSPDPLMFLPPAPGRLICVKYR
jgi:hypothetical protein